MSAPSSQPRLDEVPATRRAVEFAALYVAIPVVHVVYFDALGTFLPLAAMVLCGAVLLAVTPGFRWRELVDPRGLRAWLPYAGGFIAVAAAVILGFTLVLVPGQLFHLPLHETRLWAAIMLIYPLASVLTQELIFRPLFFRRYAPLFGSDAAAIVANAAVYALVHAFYQNWVAIVLTFGAGLIFGWTYRRSGSFPLVVLMHAVAGQLVFTIGLGVYFYHGAIG
ncbi:CAAX protease self-immunity [Limimonas halophila]|uniref:CAAX protease self-immunity n=1 Tax=Limimonas halophila TaxID=1082479 RepID=A0A1G7L9G2_9PROT|nr:CPBP family intramembrane glutamic endopeptidase [Limimonas halophila]SDF45944.1 CAAX protease self-immunity [Limimonas halophila]